MKLPGTILPTAASLAADNAYAARIDRQKSERAAALGLNNGVKTRLETEYHDGRFYRIVGSDMRVRLFEKRADGDYFVRFE